MTSVGWSEYASRARRNRPGQRRKERSMAQAARFALRGAA